LIGCWFVGTQRTGTVLFFGLNLLNEVDELGVTQISDSLENESLITNFAEIQKSMITL